MNLLIFPRIVVGTLASLLNLVAIPPTTAETDEPHQRLWHAAISAEVAPESDDGFRFSLGTVAQGPSHLIGGFAFENGVIDPQKRTAVIIDGSLADDGTFLPNVDLQVGDELNGNWKTVASCTANGAAAEITVDPGITIVGLKVKLDAIQPFIGTHKFGRVVLTSGEAAIFELSDLAPPP